MSLTLPPRKLAISYKEEKDIEEKKPQKKIYIYIYISLSHKTRDREPKIKNPVLII